MRNDRHHRADNSAPALGVRAGSERGRDEAGTRIAQARLGALVEQMPGMIWTTDVNLIITTSVGAGLAGLGLKSHELVGVSLQEFFGKDDPTREHLGIHLRALRGESVSTTVTFRDRTYLSRLEPLKDATGRITGIIGVALDITDRWRAEDRFRSQYQEMPVPTFTWEKTAGGFRLIDVNKAAETITKGRIREFLGVSADELFDHAPEIHADLARSHERRSTQHRQTRYRLKTTGEEKDLAFTFVYLPPDHVMIHAEDVTERLAAQEALCQTNQMLQSLIAASPLAIVTLDRDDRVVTWNASAEETFGWNEAEILGKPLPYIPQARRQEFDAVRRAELRGEASAGTETRVLRKDGTLIDVSLWTAPVRDKNGVIIRTIGILADNTDRKRAENQLHENSERLLALSRRLLDVQESERRYLARELHDEIGQCLTGLGFMLDLSHETISPAGREKLDMAQDFVRDLTARVRDLSLRLRPTMLDDLGLVPAILWHIDRFIDQTKVHVTFHHDVPDRRLNPREVETVAFRIVQEALTNVARHSGAKTAIVRLHLDTSKLRVQVEDWGVGFDYEATCALGTSSGLSGMHERAVLVNGWLCIDSRPGKGTCVTAELPVQELEERRRSAFDPVTRG